MKGFQHPVNNNLRGNRFLSFILHLFRLKFANGDILLKGNPVRTGNYPRSCNPDAEKALYFPKLHTTVEYAQWEGAGKSGESEDLPERFNVSAFGGKALTAVTLFADCFC